MNQSDNENKLEERLDRFERYLAILSNYVRRIQRQEESTESDRVLSFLEPIIKNVTAIFAAIASISGITIGLGIIIIIPCFQYIV